MMSETIEEKGVEGNMDMGTQERDRQLKEASLRSRQDDQNGKNAMLPQEDRMPLGSSGSEEELRLMRDTNDALARELALVKTELDMIQRQTSEGVVLAGEGNQEFGRFAKRGLKHSPGAKPSPLVVDEKELIDLVLRSESIEEENQRLQEQLRQKSVANSQPPVSANQVAELEKTVRQLRAQLEEESKAHAAALVALQASSQLAVNDEVALLKKELQVASSSVQELTASVAFYQSGQQTMKEKHDKMEHMLLTERQEREKKLEALNCELRETREKNEVQQQEMPQLVHVLEQLRVTQLALDESIEKFNRSQKENADLRSERTVLVDRLEGKASGAEAQDPQTLDGRLDDWKARSEQDQTRIRSLEEEIKKKTTAISSGAEELKKSRADVLFFQKSVEEGRRLVDKYKSEVKRLEGDVERLKSDVDEVKGMQVMQAQHFKSSESFYQNEVEELKTKLQSVQKTELSLLANQTELRAALSLKQEELRVVTYDRDQLHIQLLQAQAQIPSSRELEHAKQKQDLLYDQVGVLTKRFEAMSDEAQMLREQIIAAGLTPWQARPSNAPVLPTTPKNESSAVPGTFASATQMKRNFSTSSLVKLNQVETELQALKAKEKHEESLSKQELSQTQARCTSLSSQIKELESKCQKFIEEKKILALERDQITEKHAQATSALSALGMQKGVSDKAVEGLQKKIVALQLEADAATQLKLQVTRLQNQLEQAKEAKANQPPPEADDITCLSRSECLITAFLDASKTAAVDSQVQEKIMAIRALFPAAPAAIEPTVEQKGLKEELSKEKTRREKLESELASLKVHVSTLQTFIETKSKGQNTPVVASRDNEAKLQREVVDLKKKLSGAQSAVDELQSAIDQYRRGLEEALEKNEMLLSEKLKLSEKTALLTEELGRRKGVSSHPTPLSPPSESKSFPANLDLPPAKRVERTNSIQLTDLEGVRQIVQQSVKEISEQQRNERSMLAFQRNQEQQISSLRDQLRVAKQERDSLQVKLGSDTADGKAALSQIDGVHQEVGRLQEQLKRSHDEAVTLREQLLQAEEELKSRVRKSSTDAHEVEMKDTVDAYKRQGADCM